MESYPEPVLDDRTSDIRDKPLSSVTIWCTSGNLHHWISSYKLVDQIVVAPKQTIAGISMNMHQPLEHEFHTGEETNLFGSLHIHLRTAEKGLVSRRSGVLEEIKFLCTITVRDIVDLVLAERRQYYMFSPLGSGCLYWQLQLLRAYVSKGWIKGTDVDKAIGSIEKYAKENEAKVPFPPVEGQFYDPPM
ncbi:hypothetical protein GLOTRDRAFT_128977 [Gloeophyllum trabeum ATCC 11539]|uniref:DUF7770 domain-containing protein n=1 Tax=Gloeophyllum trabeum (strain ATCC 11539 / FP-39264 / Madison 617) TaxID=670483 RepID=S7RMS0_GLOTA|nr:uncharacterized protein GLOTRDRAFT_128977 [Gloeophyllum trabeum ATCC 11539]EPQ55760.1 hypothetical protein GLOTRDRAFT_128977 [Gloeophyllum trabeum ATCC 11539]